MPEDLPNPYQKAPGPPPRSAASFGVVDLDTASCWELVQHGSLGRFAVDGADGAPDVFPMNYLVHEGSVYVRSGPGSKLRSILDHASVAFEIDGEDLGHRWSVVIRVTARRLDSDDEIEAAGVLRLQSWSPTPKQNFIQLTPRTVTGRRFPKMPAGHSAAHRPPVIAHPTIMHDGSLDKPLPIPHFPPFSDHE
ncbi:hypothetical protein O159_09480 [Leifsonia xyli subsp. cynodontis DSM 46306]|uniref:Flavin-nucleotide-binding protein n=1 Tax=Leifsonia xyli subsp. cynodontis DSM 46306 TaxID=1389489 RepID=U3PC32_LEIXC|nr:pyridoxamine 5'-phosphate oxidase family protein [Leifsonia xyli]AGW41078.1 hypothetical protein O159_09480 [Leifsonia xyli subsp. cynodontis DSM 46306]